MDNHSGNHLGNHSVNHMDKYKKAFREGLSIDNDNIEDLEYRSVEEWDSVGHLTLIMAIEEAFEIALDTDDILDFSSFKKGKEILVRYNVEL